MLAKVSSRKAKPTQKRTRTVSREMIETLFAKVRFLYERFSSLTVDTNTNCVEMPLDLHEDCSTVVRDLKIDLEACV